MNLNINLEDYLHKIDLIFKHKNKKEIQMVYVMIFSVIFAFSYLLFWDSSFDIFMEKQSKINSLESKISIDNVYMKVNPQQKILRLNTQIIKANSEIATLKDNNEYIKHKIDTISSLIYNERAWGEYIYSISENAKKYSVKILNFKNSFALTGKSFGHMLDISVKSSGKYRNTLKFINSLEQSNLVVDIHGLSIDSGDLLTTDLNISVWGINY